MKEQLSHILDQSVCLTRRQVAAYLEGRMEPEELHAAQVHLASCPLCSLAMDGFEAHTEEGLAALSSLNTDFLKEQFDKSLPQIHLNSVAPAAVIRESRRRRRAGEHRVMPFGRLAAAAVFALAAGGLWWLFQNAGKDAEQAGGREIAVATPAAAPVTTPSVPPAAPQPGTSTGSTPAVAAAEPPSSQQLKSPAQQAAAPSSPVTAPPAGAVVSAPQRDDAAEAAVAAAPAMNGTADAPAASPGYSRAASPEARSYGNSFESTGTTNYSISPEVTTNASQNKVAFSNAYTVTGPAMRKAAPAAPTLRPPQAVSKPTLAFRVDRSTNEVPPVIVPDNLEAARKALADGKKDEAKRILQAIVKQGGSEKREAKKMLRKMNREE